MTAGSGTQATPSPISMPAVHEPTFADRLRWAVQDTGTMTWRDLIRTKRQPEMLSFGVIMGVFFLLLFYWVFGGAISAGTGVDYLQYLVPGIFVITALVGAQQTGTGLAMDLAEGVTDRFRSLPMSQFAVLGGRTVADTFRNLAGVVLVAAVGYLLGFRFASFWGAVGAIVLAVAIGFAFSWMNAAIAAKVRNAEMVGMLSMFWLFPLMLASTVFTPAEQMPSWLRGLAEWQPISIVGEACRKLSNGIPAGDDVLWSLAWIIVLLLVFVPLAVAAYRKP
jgi:ABC-2 type transport system permease protein/oleandomycin transport system permease protein